MMLYRYSRWDGTQASEMPSVDELIEHVAEEILQGGDLQSVLRRMLRGGAELPQGRRMMGLQELLERLRGGTGTASSAV